MLTTRSHLSLLLFLLGAFFFSGWSWVLMDPNFTLINHANWTMFRNAMLGVGYHNRPLSAGIFAVLVLILTFGSLCMIKWYRGHIWKVALAVAVIAGILSYPALSHDLFNYIFDARILTHYHQNPYLFRALDFPADPMLRFMHWVHRTYPYGPTYLLASAVPSVLGMGVFSLTFLLFKSMNALLYFVVVWLFEKKNRLTALIFATSPIVIVEGLVNSHNDFTAVSFALIGIYFGYSHKSTLTSLLLIVFSGLMKYFTLPVLIFSVIKKKFDYSASYAVWLVFVMVAVLVGYISTIQEVQPWYFLNFLVVLPFIPWLYGFFSISLLGLLLSYYPYVIGGEWGQGGDIQIKHQIILGACILNALWFFTKILYSKHRGSITSHPKKI